MVVKALVGSELDWCRLGLLVEVGGGVVSWCCRVLWEQRFSLGL